MLISIFTTRQFPWKPRWITHYLLVSQWKFFLQANLQQNHSSTKSLFTFWEVCGLFWLYSYGRADDINYLLPASLKSILLRCLCTFTLLLQLLWRLSLQHENLWSCLRIMMAWERSIRGRFNKFWNSFMFKKPKKTLWQRQCLCSRSGAIVLPLSTQDNRGSVTHF